MIQPDQSQGNRLPPGEGLDEEAGEVVLQETNFASEVLNSPQPVLVDFWAPWCGPCRLIGPVVEQLARQYAGRMKVGKLNTDENPRIAAQYGIMSIPTLMLFKGGQVVERLVGALPRPKIEERIISHLL